MWGRVTDVKIVTASQRACVGLIDRQNGTMSMNEYTQPCRAEYTQPCGVEYTQSSRAGCISCNIVCELLRGSVSSPAGSTQKYSVIFSIRLKLRDRKTL